MAPIPITVVTGFLGSGKTTLLSRVLEDPSMKNTAVLVNEFGEVGLDHQLLRRVTERTVLLGSGCICCTERGDLAEALSELLDLHQRGEIPVLDRVVVETTGLADPAPILHTVFANPMLQHHFTVDLVITTVDAVNGSLHLRNNTESVKQISSADKVILTKTDIGGPAEQEELASRIDAINPSAHIIEAAFGVVDVGALLSPALRTEEETNRTTADVEAHEMAETHSVSLTFDGPVDWTAFGIWLSMLLHARGEDVLRVKGLLDVGAEGPVVLDGVQHVIHPPQHLDRWPDGDHSSRIIFITKRVPPGEILESLQAFSALLGAFPLRLGAAVATTGEGGR